jgi:PAS domain S-box-containing protein
MARTLMVVDDDEGMRDNLKDILEDEGYVFHSASNCAEALAIAEKHRPQVALLDLKLPDGSGLNLMAGLKKQNPDFICIMVTAYADLDSAVGAIEKGAFQYLQKPVRTIELMKVLDRVFEIIQIREDKQHAEKLLRESEERFRTIFESARDVVFLKDKDLRYTLVNPRMERLFNLPAGEFLGRTDEEIFHTAKNESSDNEDGEVLKGNVVEHEETRIILNEPKTFHSIKVPLYGNSGEIIGLCGINRDVTETKKLEAQLIQAQKMEAIGILAGGISHDFNNLLQAILGYTQMLMLEKSEEDPDYSRLQEIEDAGRKAKELIRQLLTFSRKVESKPKPLDLNLHVKEVTKLLVRTLPKMIQIEMNLEEAIHTVNADPGQLDQVIMNLAVNARDAMPEGGKLVISTANVWLDDAFCRNHVDLRPGNHVLLSIRDNGQGMDKRTQEHIFEPFYTTKTTGEGTGLGLSMAYGIVKNHQGAILCESRKGSGTIFNIYFPAIHVNAKKLERKKKMDVPKGKGETILVIDDEEVLRKLLSQVLTLHEYRVLTAATGEEGFTLYGGHREEIALVVLDMIMPGMGGKNCMKRILSENPGAKILLTTGFPSKDTRNEAQKEGALGFIEKPFDFGDILRVIRKVIAPSESNGVP